MGFDECRHWRLGLHNINDIIKDGDRCGVPLAQAVEHRQCCALRGVDLRPTHRATAVNHQRNMDRRAFWLRTV